MEQKHLRLFIYDLYPEISIVYSLVAVILGLIFKINIVTMIKIIAVGICIIIGVMLVIGMIKRHNYATIGERGSRFVAPLKEIKYHQSKIPFRSYCRLYVEFLGYNDSVLEYTSRLYHYDNLEIETDTECYVVLYNNVFHLDEDSIKIKGKKDIGQGYISEIPKTKKK